MSTGKRRFWRTSLRVATCCALAVSGCGKSAERPSESEPAEGRAAEPAPGTAGACDPRDAPSCPLGQLCRAATPGSGNVCASSAPPDAGTPGAADGGSSDECVGSACGSAPPLVTPPPLGALGEGACLACARGRCGAQFDAALGADSTPENQADVALVLACVLGPDWQTGNAIPTSSCFFVDPVQPRGSLVPCYCGTTPVATCVATGPADPMLACASVIQIASHCSPISPVCVTSSGSDPSVPLGDVLQLLNCERAACESECGFPASMLDE